MGTKKLQEIIAVLRDGLVSIYLYQKGADEIPVFVVKDVNFVLLDSIRPLFARERFIILTQDNISQGSDVFCLQLLNIKNHSDLFYGSNILSNFKIEKTDLRASLELDLRNKCVQLREGYLSQDKGKDFLKHILLGMQIVREGALLLKSPDMKIPKDMKELLSLFDIAWSCNSQNFYYLLDDKVEEGEIPALIHRIHVYLSDLCNKI
ncbi:MAG: hypothetical protein NTY80_00500 [candidate division SR1 bacterium]|nr:hypothetical protein [candidate division SR1 bacterium]